MYKSLFILLNDLKIFFPILLLSVLLTYNYAIFEDNMSIGVGYAYTAKSIALDYNYAVTEYKDAAGVDIIKIGNDYYLPYAPLPSFLFAGSYFVLQIYYYVYINFVGSINGDISYIFESIFLKIPVALAHFFTSVLIYRFSRKLGISNKISVISAYSYGIGTFLFNYTLSNMKHNFSVFAILLAIYLIFKYEKISPKYSYLLGAGIAFGIGFLSELPVILICVAYFIYQLLQYFESKKLTVIVKKLMFVGVPVLLSVVLLLIFQNSVYGNAFVTGDQLFQQQQIALGKNSFSFSRNIIEGYYGLFFAPLKGILWVSPFLIFGFLGIHIFYKDAKYKQFAIFILLYMLAIVSLYATWSDCFGASPFGVRHISTVVPLLVIFSGYYVDSTNNVLKSIYYTLIGVSMFIMLSVAMSGLPSGIYSGCPLNEFGSYNQVIGIYKNKNFAPVILKYILTGESI